MSPGDQVSWWVRYRALVTARSYFNVVHSHQSAPKTRHICVSQLATKCLVAHNQVNACHMACRILRYLPYRGLLIALQNCYNFKSASFDRSRPNRLTLFCAVIIYLLLAKDSPLMFPAHRWRIEGERCPPCWYSASTVWLSQERSYSWYNAIRNRQRLRLSIRKHGAITGNTLRRTSPQLTPLFQKQAMLMYHLLETHRDFWIHPDSHFTSGVLEILLMLIQERF